MARIMRIDRPIPINLTGLGFWRVGGLLFDFTIVL